MYKDRQRKILDQLFILAQDVTPVSKARVAAALFYKNKMIAFAVNQSKTHPMAARFSKHPEANSLHAEVACIRNAINRYGIEIIKKSTMYIARAKQGKGITSEFVWGMAKPCRGCEHAINTFGIKKVVYTTDIHNHICVGYY